MIYVGSIEGGPELVESAAHDAIEKIKCAVDKRRSSWEEGTKPGLDIVFHVEGSVWGPDFEGVRTAKFSRNKKLLMVQCPVCKEMLSSEHIGPALCEMMREGARLAKPVFEQAGIPFDEKEFADLIWDLEEELGWLST